MYTTSSQVEVGMEVEAGIGVGVGGMLGMIPVVDIVGMVEAIVEAGIEAGKAAADRAIGAEPAAGIGVADVGIGVAIAAADNLGDAEYCRWRPWI